MPASAFWISSTVCSSYPGHRLGRRGHLGRGRLGRLLLLGRGRGRELGGRLVPGRVGQPLERRVGGDLQRLGRAVVLGVLEELLLPARSPDEVERGLAEG